MADIECLFDVGSPTTYLAWRRLPDIAARTGASVTWTPVLLGGIFKATGNAAPGLVPARGAYMGRDMARFAEKHGVAFAMNPFFPINTLTMMRILAGVAGSDRFMPVAEAFFAAMWQHGRNMGDPAELAGALTDAGLDPAALLPLADDPAVKAKLVANTESAVARGAFGAPTFFVGGEMFFGQDRLDWVEDYAGR